MNELQIKMVKAGALAFLALAGLLYVYEFSRSIDKTYPSKTFTVDGTGEIDVTPDLATVSVTVMTEGGKDVAEVQKQNADKMTQVNKFLKDGGVEKKDLKTTNYSLQPRYSNLPCVRGACPPQTIIGYTLVETLEVKIRDTEKLGAILTGVVENGANSVSEVRFVVDDESDAKDDARMEAMKEAKKKAEAIADAGGFRLGKLVTLYENSDPTPFYGGMGGASEAAALKSAVPPTVEPGTQATKVQMTLTYEILQ